MKKAIGVSIMVPRKRVISKRSNPQSSQSANFRLYDECPDGIVGRRFDAVASFQIGRSQATVLVTMNNGEKFELASAIEDFAYDLVALGLLPVSSIPSDLQELTGLPDID